MVTMSIVTRLGPSNWLSTKQGLNQAPSNSITRSLSTRPLSLFVLYLTKLVYQNSISIHLIYLMCTAFHCGLNCHCEMRFFLPCDVLKMLNFENVFTVIFLSFHHSR